MQSKTIKEMKKMKKEEKEFNHLQLVEKAENEKWEELHFPDLKVSERDSRLSTASIKENDVE